PALGGRRAPGLGPAPAALARADAGRRVGWNGGGVRTRRRPHGVAASHSAVRTGHAGVRLAACPGGPDRHRLGPGGADRGSGGAFGGLVGTRTPAIWRTALECAPRQGERPRAGPVRPEVARATLAGSLVEAGPVPGGYPARCAEEVRARDAPV